MSSSVDFWYRRISRSATVPGRKRCGFFTPPVVAAAVLRACDLAASCLRGALPVRAGEVSTASVQGKKAEKAYHRWICARSAWYEPFQIM
ncbi:hypothetical protein DFH11DRAFT_1616725 [Phellopilus nigrolimitatus]|nr:hypothetical protein DFH11DRAFT_1616725 [Phellopilus nigrolimitatus]